MTWRRRPLGQIVPGMALDDQPDREITSMSGTGRPRTQTLGLAPQNRLHVMSPLLTIIYQLTGSCPERRNGG
jgi:hypothetical protein